MQLSASIFKAYDIRGVVPVTLDVEVAEALGRAFGSAARAAGEKSVAVGRDGRLSGPSLAEALIKGLVATGVEVIDVGAVTTPMLYFAAHTLCRSGIQVTGSHNPKDYNGFKMVLAGRAIYGDEIQGLRRTMEAGSAQLAAGGSVRKVDVTQAYIERIAGGECVVGAEGREYGGYGAARGHDDHAEEDVGAQDAVEEGGDGGRGRVGVAGCVGVVVSVKHY